MPTTPQVSRARLHLPPRAGPLALVVGAIILTLLGLAAVLVPTWPPSAACNTQPCIEGREWIASCLTVLVLLGGLYQYWRAQLWKRAEFIAAEMDKFFSLPAVRRATIMIDWDRRNVNLFESQNPDPKTWPLVTRDIQILALLPHTVRGLSARPDAAAETEDSELAAFTIVEATIRDTYDTFLDGLERFSGFLATGLVTAHDMRPYLGYWLKDVVDTECSDVNAIWTCCFLSYVHFYGYHGVQALFRAYGHEIAVTGTLFAHFLDKAAGCNWAAALRQELNVAETRPADRGGMSG